MLQFAVLFVVITCSVVHIYLALLFVYMAMSKLRPASALNFLRRVVDVSHVCLYAL